MAGGSEFHNRGVAPVKDLPPSVGRDLVLGSSSLDPRLCADRFVTSIR